MRVFNVYLRGKCIDTVFYSDKSSDGEDDVKRSLVNHDGYSPDIKVRLRRESRV